MKKIAVIGSIGAGKTTLANELSRNLKIKVYHLDRLFWRSGWTVIEAEKRRDILQYLVLEEQWIIEGTYLKLSESRLQSADAIIFLDTPALVCLLRITKRYNQNAKLSHRDIPIGCTTNLTLRMLFGVMTFPFRERRYFEKVLKQYPEKVIRLHTVREIKDFLMRPEMYLERNRKIELGHENDRSSLIWTKIVRLGIRHLSLKS